MKYLAYTTQPSTRKDPTKSSTTMNGIGAAIVKKGIKFKKPVQSINPENKKIVGDGKKELIKPIKTVITLGKKKSGGNIGCGCGGGITKKYQMGGKTGAQAMGEALPQGYDSDTNGSLSSSENVFATTMSKQSNPGIPGKNSVPLGYVNTTDPLLPKANPMNVQLNNNSAGANNKSNSIGTNSFGMKNFIGGLVKSRLKPVTPATQTAPNTL